MILQVGRQFMRYTFLDIIEINTALILGVQHYGFVYAYIAQNHYHNKLN